MVTRAKDKISAGGTLLAWEETGLLSQGLSAAFPLLPILPAW
jgi:hypothetical protein